MTLRALQEIRNCPLRSGKRRIETLYFEQMNAPDWRGSNFSRPIKIPWYGGQVHGAPNSGNTHIELLRRGAAVSTSHMIAKMGENHGRLGFRFAQPVCTQNG
jgi:hypothetical protein